MTWDRSKTNTVWWFGLVCLGALLDTSGGAALSLLSTEERLFFRIILCKMLPQIEQWEIYFTRCIHVKHLLGVSRSPLAVEEVTNVSIPYSVPKTRIWYEQSGLRFLDFKKVVFLIALFRRENVNLVNAHFTLEVLPNGNMQMLLERANRILLARCWLCPPPCLLCPLWLICSNWKRRVEVNLSLVRFLNRWRYCICLCH
jgi:hypothetical protein